METFRFPVEIFLGMLGVSLSLIFCTLLCRACQQGRQNQLRTARLNQGQVGSSVYVIPIPRNLPRQDSNSHRMPISPNHFPDYHAPPPAYTELEFKPEDLPPPYAEFDDAVTPGAPPAPTDRVVSP